MATTSEQTIAPAFDRPAAPRSGKAAAALATGILGVAGALFPLAGIALGVVAICLGAVARTEQRERVMTATSRWTAIAGLALGAIAVALSLGLFIASTASG